MKHKNKDTGKCLTSRCIHDILFHRLQLCSFTLRFEIRDLFLEIGIYRPRESVLDFTVKGEWALTGYDIFNLQRRSVKRVVGITQQMRPNSSAVNSDFRAGKYDRIFHESVHKRVFSQVSKKSFRT